MFVCQGFIANLFAFSFIFAKCIYIVFYFLYNTIYCAKMQILFFLSFFFVRHYNNIKHFKSQTAKQKHFTATGHSDSEPMS